MEVTGSCQECVLREPKVNRKGTGLSLLNRSRARITITIMGIVYMLTCYIASCMNNVYLKITFRSRQESLSRKEIKNEEKKSPFNLSLNRSNNNEIKGLKFEDSLYLALRKKGVKR